MDSTLAEFEQKLISACEECVDGQPGIEIMVYETLKSSNRNERHNCKYVFLSGVCAWRVSGDFRRDH